MFWLVDDELYFLKMVELYKDPTGDKVFSKTTGNGGNSSIHQITKVRVDGTNDEALRKKISDLEVELKGARVCCIVIFKLYCFQSSKYVKFSNSKFTIAYYLTFKRSHSFHTYNFVRFVAWLFNIMLFVFSL